MNYFAGLLMALVAAGGPAAPAAAPTASLSAEQLLSLQDQAWRGKTYVALGDSITVGSHAATEDLAFPSRVAAQLGMNLTVVGRSGARAAWALPRLEIVQASQPALVTIQLGTNDVGFNTPLDEFAQTYETIASAVAIPGIRVLCVGSWLPGAAIDSLIRQACERHGGTFVSLDGFYEAAAFHAQDGVPTFRGPADWFHPGDVGHAAIAAAILTSLRGRADGQATASASQPGPASSVTLIPQK